MTIETLLTSLILGSLILLTAYFLKPVKRNSFKSTHEELEKDFFKNLIVDQRKAGFL